MLLELFASVIVREAGGPPTGCDEKLRPDGVRRIGSWQAVAPFTAKQIFP
jgi:hypothetical protein